MFIQTEDTPNPNAMRFIIGRPVSPSQVVEFIKGDDTTQAPLARQLLRIDLVERVMFGDQFITLTKTPEADWYVVKPLALGAMLEFFVTNQPIFMDMADAEGDNTASEDSPLVAHIKDLLDTRIRPAVAMDGGDIIFERFEDGIVFVRMKGACSGCPSSTATLKSGIENMLKHYISEVEEVRAI
jgi:Fe-S cluster biogenesis protein NfuA